MSTSELPVVVMQSSQNVAILLCVILSGLRVHGQTYSPVEDSSRICLATYYQRVDGEFLIGKWYYIYHFASLSNLPPSTECRGILFERPTEDQLVTYIKTYNATGVPYTFDGDLVLYSETWSDFASGLLIGGKEAKFFLQKPRGAGAPPDYQVIVLKVINNDYLVYQDCSLRGFSKWLISRKKHLSKEEFKDIIKGQSDLKQMEKQKFCDVG